MITLFNDVYFVQMLTSFTTYICSMPTKNKSKSQDGITILGWSYQLRMNLIIP